jgi:hypothetical protein
MGLYAERDDTKQKNRSSYNKKMPEKKKKKDEKRKSVNGKIRG